MELNDHTQRAHAVLSASSAHRWIACPSSAAAALLYENRDTEFTKEGTVAHEVAEAVANGGTPSGEEVTQEMIECATGYRDYIQERLTNNAPTVLLEQRVDFSRWVPGGFGTADCIIVQGGTVSVIDYKYGQGVAVSAEDNPQMRLYALGAYDLLSDIYDIDTIETHIYQPRINNISTETIRVEDLLSWADTVLVPAAASAVSGEDNWHAGEHCRFCPHAGSCKELAETCMSVVEMDGRPVEIRGLAPFEVADILRAEPMISLWLKSVKERALSTLLDGGEIPGYKVVEGRGSRAWSDEIRVADTLKSAGYSLEDITETSLLSVAKMEKAIGKKKAAELVGGMIEKKSGSPTIAPVTDKRPPYNRLEEAQEDFKE